MKLYTLRTEQLVKATPEACWDFFSSPRNLKVITPDYMGFDIVSGGDTKMYAGQIIEYRVSPLLGIKTPWITEITHVVEGKFFVDEQRLGPYKLWHHQHHFTPVEEGVMMYDIVSYTLPYDPFSRLMHPLIVRPKLKEIFDYRYQKIETLFNRSASEQAATG